VPEGGRVDFLQRLRGTRRDRRGGGIPGRAATYRLRPFEGGAKSFAQLRSRLVSKRDHSKAA
jgi:hypothetical protein